MLKRSVETNVRDHRNNLNKCITQLLSAKVKIDDKDKVIIFLASPPKWCDTLVTAVLVGKTMLTMDEVSTTLLETANMKQPSSSSHTKQVLMVTSDASRGRRKKTRGRYYERRDDHSQSSSWKDVECLYCYEKGHIRRNCEKLTRHLEERKKQKAEETKVQMLLVISMTLKIVYILLLLRELILTLGF